jgi:hypothetical protein
MNVLFDQCTPVGIRKALSSHRVVTAHEKGWSGLLNGELLQAAETAGFDVLLTADKNLAYQQNLERRRIAVVALGASRWSVVKDCLHEIARAVEAARPGTYTLVLIGTSSS